MANSFLKGLSNFGLGTADDIQLDRQNGGQYDQAAPNYDELSDMFGGFATLVKPYNEINGEDLLNLGIDSALTFTPGGMAARGAAQAGKAALSNAGKKMVGDMFKDTAEVYGKAGARKMMDMTPYDFAMRVGDDATKAADDAYKVRRYGSNNDRVVDSLRDYWNPPRGTVGSEDVFSGPVSKFKDPTPFMVRETAENAANLSKAANSASSAMGKMKAMPRPTFGGVLGNLVALSGPLIDMGYNAAKNYIQDGSSPWWMEER